MKHLSSSTLAAIAAGTLFPAAGLYAQAPAAPGPTPSVSVPAAPGNTAVAGGAQPGAGQGPGAGRLRAQLAALTPEERQELKAAHDKALQDPAVKAAEAQRASDPRAFRRTVIEAMLRLDPAIKPVLEKMRANGPHAQDFNAS